VHPTQLYSSLAAFALFGALLALDSRGPRPGSVTCAFLVGWAGCRLALDAFRHYPESLVALRVLGLGVPPHQVVALLAAGGAGAIALAARRSTGPSRSSVAS
jgi:prolipoprotein diacylglyceryltransferase